MSNRSCPNCSTKVSFLKLTVMGPNECYRCSQCGTSLTVNKLRNRILIYGGLFTCFPIIFYFRAAPSLEAGIVLLISTALLIACALLFQKVEHAKT